MGCEERPKDCLLGSRRLWSPQPPDWVPSMGWVTWCPCSLPSPLQGCLSRHPLWEPGWGTHHSPHVGRRGLHPAAQAVVQGEEQETLLPAQGWGGRQGQPT